MAPKPPSSLSGEANAPIRRSSGSSYDTNSVTKTNSTSGGTSSKGSSSGGKRGILRSRRGSQADSSDVDARESSAGKSTASTTVDEEGQKKRDRKVCMIRGAMISTLLVATVVVAALTYVYVHNDEESNFHDQYRDSVSKVAEAFQHGIEIKHDSASTFSAMYTSRYGNAAQDLSVWPNATMPDFQQQAEGQLKLAESRALSFNPIITQDVNRLEWEAHATESAYILESEALVNPPPGSTWPDNRTVAFGIYSRDSEGNIVYDPGYAPTSRYPDVMVPVWQIAPIDTNVKAVMFNLHSESNRERALDDMLFYRVPALTAILQLVQDTDLRPSSILFYPVFDEFNSEIPNIERTVVGSVSIVFSWDTLLASILPDYIKGMICVLQSSIGQTYSYSISGDTVTLLGEGDMHDPKYHDMGSTVKANLGNTEELLGQVDNLITYKLSIYPSQEFEDLYVTNRAGIYTAGVVLIFVCTAALFLLYDYLVEDRQQKTARLARQTSTIVDSMFPAAFRERLYKSQGKVGASARSSSQNSERRPSEDTLLASNTTGGMANGKADKRRSQSPGISNGEKRRSTTMGAKMTLKQIDKFMKGIVSAPSDHQTAFTHGEDDEPIAELFLDTSIMFSDIVGKKLHCSLLTERLWHLQLWNLPLPSSFPLHSGFTKWSSERSPNEVFKLLERLFWKFDEIAERQNIFKLGTIGDCYIAVTGIPDPIDDHATVLTQFAFDCRQKVEEVCAELDAEGLDTSKLSMRFGIHSGAITAGILRGTKSRFELFGDTINTASRMESTGRAGLIQVSEETAELIRLDRKEKWLHKRDELITAKGKGKMQTYWVEPGRDGNRVSFLDAVDDSLTEAKILRMSEETSSSDKYYNQYRDSEYDEEKTEETPDNGFDVIVEVNNAEAEDEEKQTEQKPSEAFKIPTDDNV